MAMDQTTEMPEDCPDGTCGWFLGNGEPRCIPSGWCKYLDQETGCRYWRLQPCGEWGTPLCPDASCDETVDYEPGVTQFITCNGDGVILPPDLYGQVTQEGGVTTWTFPGIDPISWQDTNTQLSPSEVCGYMNRLCPPPVSSLTQQSDTGAGRYIFNFKNGAGQTEQFQVCPPKIDGCNWLTKDAAGELFVPNPNWKPTNDRVAYVDPPTVDISDFPVGQWTDVVPEEACITIESSPCCNMVHFIYLNPSSAGVNLGNGWIVQLSGLWTQDGAQESPVLRPNDIDTTCLAEGCEHNREEFLPADIFPWLLPMGADNVDICMKIKARVVVKGTGVATITPSNFRVESWGQCIGI